MISLNLEWDTSRTIESLDDASANSAALRLAEALAAGTRIVNTPLYRLLQIKLSNEAMQGSVAMTDFISYALTMDLLENELIDAIAEGRPTRPGSLVMRDRYLPTAGSVVNIAERMCAGGALALFAAARPASGTRGQADYVLLIQERSGRVLNAARRLSVIPKSFHEPLVDFVDDAQLVTTLEREMEEELFTRPEVDSTNAERRPADPLHPARLSPPLRWLVEHAGTGAWSMECTGFGLNLVSGNFEFACLIVVNDEKWWREFGGHIEANWESDGLRRYSTVDTDGITHLIHDTSWSNEGLFAFVQGIRRLTEIGAAGRVRLPSIELEV